MVQTHRDQFGEIADVNYEGLFRDVSNINISFQLPNPTMSHIAKPHRVTNMPTGMPLPVKHSRVTNENDSDYYGMVDKLTQYVRNHSSTNLAKPVTQRNHSLEKDTSLNISVDNRN